MARGGVRGARPATRGWTLTALGAMVAAGVPGTCRECGAALRYLPVARVWTGTAGHEPHRCWVDGAQ